MFKFDMQIDQNYASFYHQESGKAVFVDSFDNEEFDVRVGTLRESKFVTTVRAYNNDELNQKLNEATCSYLCL